MTLTDDAAAKLSSLLDQIALSPTQTGGTTPGSAPVYQVDAALPSALEGVTGLQVPVVDPIAKVSETVEFTFDLVQQQVRFAVDALGDATDPLGAARPIGGLPIGVAPIASLVMDSVQGSAADPGVPGLLGRLKGSIDLPVTPEVPGQVASVELTVSGDVVERTPDGSRVPVAGAATGFALAGAQPSVPRPPLTTVTLPAPTVQMVRLTPSLPTVGHRDFTVDATFTLQGQVAATTGSPAPLSVSVSRTLHLDLPPLPWPVVPIPTVAILTDTKNFSLVNGGDPAKIFVILPFGQLPGDGPSTEHALGSVPALSQLFSTLEAAQGLVGGALGALSALLTLLTPGHLPGIDLGGLLGIHLDGQPGTGQFIRYGSTEFPHLENYDWNHGDFSDTARSVLLIGPPSTKLELFNSAELDDSEGQLTLTTGASCIVAVPDLADPKPLDGQGTAVPTGKYGDDKFDKQVSSVRLTQVP